MPTATAYAAASARSPLAQAGIPRREPTERDVEIDILFCGICHSDLHQVRNEWSALPTVYPCVPGHEIVGRVTRVGSGVTRHAAGDLVGVGCLVDADRSCPACRDHLEQFCPHAAFTYNSPDRHGTAPVTYGGYSTSIVVDDHFVVKVPANLPLAGVAPLLCAGITTYSPIRRWGDIQGKRVGIVGLGGLGHMGVKFAHAFGAHTVVLTTSERKKDDALRLGADEVIVTRDPTAMQQNAFSFDFILDTVSAAHDINALLNLLKVDGTLTLVGAPDAPMPVSAFALLFGRKRLAGSLIGGLAETQEMLDFCGAHGITADVEVIAMQQVNEAYDRLARSDVKYRFSIDMASLKDAAGG